MIVFDLRCTEGGETFEGWFSSSADYEAQRASGLIACPFCRSTNIEKAPMAPSLPRGKTAAGDEKQSALAKLSALQRKLLAGSEWVGDRFPDEARAMHSGEAESRPVHGQATLEEARSLADEGIAVLPLPLPAIPPDQVN